MNNPLIIQQTKFLLAIMIIVGITLGISFSPWFLFLDILAGFNLLIDSLSGICLLSRGVELLPWNR